MSEHGCLDDAASTFFAPSRSINKPPTARALLIDMEETVLNSVKNSMISPIFKSD